MDRPAHRPIDLRDGVTPAPPFRRRSHEFDRRPWHRDYPSSVWEWNRPSLICAAGKRASRRFPTSSRPTSATHTRGGPTAAPWRNFCPGATNNRVPSITAAQPLHAQQQQELATLTVKLRYAASRHLLYEVVPVNPASSVRGPSHLVTAGKAPVVAPEEARLLIGSIEVVAAASLRDRRLAKGLAPRMRGISMPLPGNWCSVEPMSHRLWRLEQPISSVRSKG
jgi:hypothetical protein